MNENAKKWVAELRSGKYQQAKGRLQSDNGYCCLGVACELYEKTTGYTLKRYDGSKRFKGTSLHGDYIQVRTWLGLSGGLGEFEDDSLAAVNDSGVDFSHLSDLIESEPEGLFIDE